MSYDEAVLMPSRNWREHYSIISTLPQPIREPYNAIRRRFGIEIANIVLSAYKRWGPRVAQALAQRILEFNDLREVLDYLRKRIEVMDERSRREFSSIAYMVMYNYHFDQLISRLKSMGVPRRIYITAIRLFHSLARHGLLYDPSCIIAVALYVCGQKDRVPKRCSHVASALETHKISITCSAR